MEGIEFDSRRNNPGVGKIGDVEQKTPTLVKLLIKISAGALDEQTANYVLVGIAAVAFTLSGVIFWNISGETEINQVRQIPPMSKTAMLPAIRKLAPNVTNEMLDRLPATFYREDIPSDIAKVLPETIINAVPRKPQMK
jgi:hypothetical protein